MSSAGHVLDALNRMKQNRSMKPGNKAKFKDDLKAPINKDKGMPTNKKDIPKEMVEKEKMRINEEMQYDRNLDFKIYLGLIAIIVFFLTIAYVKLKS